ncbi:MAG TPA: RluA family pseudouridine synthase [Bdellovibrionales bacterium]|nr:RluA family pseudouridine synthase [Bdellovibrionales bacterium]
MSQREGRLSAILEEAAGVPTKRVMELLALGSVYVEGRRTHEDKHIEEGTYLRLHLKPKRYDLSKIDWSACRVFEDEHMLVVDKPKGVPVHPMVDNVVENVASQLSLRLKTPLYVTQRLDVVTSGLLVFAKTKEFQRTFNQMLKDKLIYKRYAALLEKPVAFGEYAHYMLESPRAPKTIADRPGPEGTWMECVLRVLDGADQRGHFLVHIELVTGRTHQIRAQLAHLGSPLWGDRMYGSEGPEGELHLRAVELRFTHPSTGASQRFLLS